MAIPAGGLPKWTRASPTVRAYRFDGSGAQRAPWAAAGFAALCRPHTPCRGAACRSRRCTPDSYWLPLKWYTPIASVAAFSERLVHLQIMQRKFIGMRLPSLSLQGPEGAVAISSNRLRFRRGLPVIQLCTARLPRRFAPRNDTSRSMTQGTVRCTEMAVLLPLRGRARHASPLRFALHSITKNCRTRVGAAAERISYLLRAR